MVVAEQGGAEPWPRICTRVYWHGGRTTPRIGPIAQWLFIPLMTTGAGVELLGPWFGTGADRGLALLFTMAGLIGLGVTLLAMRSAAYRALSAQYQTPKRSNGMAASAASFGPLVPVLSSQHEPGGNG